MIAAGRPLLWLQSVLKGRDWFCPRTSASSFGGSEASNGRSGLNDCSDDATMPCRFSARVDGTAAHAVITAEAIENFSSTRRVVNERLGRIDEMGRTASRIGGRYETQESCIVI